jgi:hypothetical protein
MPPGGRRSAELSSPLYAVAVWTSPPLHSNRKVYPAGLAANPIGEEVYAKNESVLGVGIDRVFICRRARFTAIHHVHRPDACQACRGEFPHTRK